MRHASINVRKSHNCQFEKMRKSHRKLHGLYGKAPQNDGRRARRP
jgi:hypothetical protein